MKNEEYRNVGRAGNTLARLARVARWSAHHGGARVGHVRHGLAHVASVARTWPTIPLALAACRVANVAINPGRYLLARVHGHGGESSAKDRSHLDGCAGRELKDEGCRPNIRKSPLFEDSRTPKFAIGGALVHSLPRAVAPRTPACGPRGGRSYWLARRGRQGGDGVHKEGGIMFLTHKLKRLERQVRALGLDRCLVCRQRLRCEIPVRSVSVFEGQPLPPSDRCPRCGVEWPRVVISFGSPGPGRMSHSILTPLPYDPQFSRKGAAQ